MLKTSNMKNMENNISTKGLFTRTSLSPSKYNIVPMETVRLIDRMGTEPILSIKWTVSIDTMINFDGNGHGDGTCKQALRSNKLMIA